MFRYLRAIVVVRKSYGLGCSIPSLFHLFTRVPVSGCVGSHIRAALASSRLGLGGGVLYCVLLLWSDYGGLGVDFGVATSLEFFGVCECVGRFVGASRSAVVMWRPFERWNSIRSFEVPWCSFGIG